MREADDGLRRFVRGSLWWLYKLCLAMLGPNSLVFEFLPLSLFGRPWFTLFGEEAGRYGTCRASQDKLGEK